MSTPNFSEYSIEDLNSSLQHIDREAYPDRFKTIQEEIQKRESAGFVLSAEDNTSQLLAPHISFSKVGLRVWWCFMWRFGLAYFLLQIPVNMVFFTFFDASEFASSPPYRVALLYTLLIIMHGALCVLLGGFFMKQTLAKNYKGFRLVIQQKSNRVTGGL